MGARFNKFNFIKTQFLMFPKGLYLYKKYKENLSALEMLSYAIIRDKAQLSYRNGFFEKNGDVYVYFTWDELMATIGCSRGTLAKTLKKLKELNLIETSKQIFSNANKMYVRELDVPESEDQLASDNICSNNICDDMVREIQQINEIAQMSSEELQEAMENGTIKPFWNRHLSDNSNGSKNEFSEFKNDEYLSSTNFDTPKVQKMNSKLVQKMNSRSSQIDNSSSSLEQESSRVGTQTISNNYTDKTDSKKDREIERERGSARACAGACAHILEGNSSDVSALEAGNPYTARIERHSEGEISPLVDNTNAGEIAGSSSVQDDFDELFTLYRENIQDTSTPLVKKSLRGLYDKFGKDIVKDAITQGALSTTSPEKKGFYYIASIAERIAGGKNNFTDYIQGNTIRESVNNDVKIMPNRKTSNSHSMQESRENIHSMIDQLFGAPNADNGGMGNDGIDKTGTY